LFTDESFLFLANSSAFVHYKMFQSRLLLTNLLNSYKQFDFFYFSFFVLLQDVSEKVGRTHNHWQQLITVRRRFLCASITISHALPKRVN